MEIFTMAPEYNTHQTRDNSRRIYILVHLFSIFFLCENTFENSQACSSHHNRHHRPGYYFDFRQKSGRGKGERSSGSRAETASKFHIFSTRKYFRKLPPQLRHRRLRWKLHVFADCVHLKMGMRDECVDKGLGSM